MPLITDPDSLSQGTVNGIADLVMDLASASQIDINSAAGDIPPLADNEFVEIRNHPQAVNNGLYRVEDAAPSSTEVTLRKITGANPVSASAVSAQTLGQTGASDEKSIHFDTGGRGIYVLEQGNVDASGVTFQAAYSFSKEEWKDDSALIPFDFPFVAITPEQFEMQEDWAFVDFSAESVRSTKIIRTGGWSEIDSSAVLQKQYCNVVTLGNFEDNTTDTAYYQLGDDPTDTNAAVDFTFPGPVNEAVLVYNNITPIDAGGSGFTFIDGGGGNDTIERSDGGSWSAEGYQVGGRIVVQGASITANNSTYALLAVADTSVQVSTGTLTAETSATTAFFAVDNRNNLAVRVRVRDGDVNGKSFDISDLPGIGVSAVDNKTFRFPLANATDLKVSAVDASISVDTPFTEIGVQYFDGTYSREVDSGTNRSYEIVIGVGTYSGIDGRTSAGGTVLSTDDAGVPSDGTYEGGTLTIYSSVADKGIAFSIATASALAINISGSVFAGDETGLSFTLQRASPVTATIQQIYEKIQYLLRRDEDINDNSPSNSVVTGRTAPELLEFVGDTLKTKNDINPVLGATAAVFIEGFDANDTNDIVFRDADGTERTFPFVAAGAINFNNNLQNDVSAQYWMFYQYTVTSTFADGTFQAASGSEVQLVSPGNLFPTTIVTGEYIEVVGASVTANNGIWFVEGTVSVGGTVLRRYDNATATNEDAIAITLRENPVDSPSALIVVDNNSASIAGNIAAASVTFDFDYDNNVQGGRTAATDANITLKAIGLDTGQYVTTNGVITRNTGLSFTLVAGLERNYSNP